MRKWSVVGTVTASKYLGIFEAETKEEAETLALESEASIVAICNHCSSECEDPAVESANAAEVV
jgi:hypothetical protein